MTKPDRSPQYAEVSDESSTTGSFDALYASESSYVWRLLGRLGVPPGDIADAVHDVFVVVYQRRAELDASRPVRPWLFGIARRVAAAARRKRRAEPLDETDAPIAAAPPHAERDLLWRALALLDDERVEVVVLHDLEGYTGAEIATLLDLSVNTIHSRLRLAREDLVAAVRRLRGAP